MEEKLNCMKQIKNKDLEIRESSEFIHLIEASQDKSYESFSPQNYNSITDSERIEELKRKRDILKNEKREFQMELERLEQKIVEVDLVVNSFNTSEVDYKNMEKELESSKEMQLDLFEIWKDERKELIEKLQGSILKEFDGAVRKTELCIRFADMDPKRCKLELQEIKKTLENICFELKDVIHRVEIFKEKSL